jgi:hypothetical protein
MVHELLCLMESEELQETEPPRITWEMKHTPLTEDEYYKQTLKSAIRSRCLGIHDTSVSVSSQSNSFQSNVTVLLHYGSDLGVPKWCEYAINIHKCWYSSEYTRSEVNPYITLLTV